ncbi:hypothetical protein ASG76_09895 [Nocardioides sp. Soil774]|uniref:hypothetical protein n=1 Tax=Nocardioides sp. Soil774 TaxID=1736408 RepID=UPI0006F7DC3B|nr:hypothetical protein [Nocardioides sp. Soil774]KRE94705.1 hypothetical protein ASG76_09895 [Nocardioides sp. Soil774]
MKRTTRLAAALVATAALAAPAASASAQAAPAPAVKGQSKQLLKDIAGKDARLARLSTSDAVTRLADDTEAELVANIADARAALGEVRTSVEAADSTVDTRAARAELRGFRVENFRIVATILAKAERLEAGAAADPVATEHLAAAEAAALAITADSTKADIRAARTHLQAAQAEVDADDTGDDATA